MRPRTNIQSRVLTNGSGRIPKVMLLISLAFIVKTITGCIDPVWDFDFSFNTITVQSLDNSEIYATKNDRDTMYAAAVAFEVTLSDDTFLASAFTRQAEVPFAGFTPAAAEPPEPRYHPLHRITGIAIVTLEPISPEISAGSDVTRLFVANVPEFSTPGFLYINSMELPSTLDMEFYPGEPSVSFQLFCMADIGSESAQFSITVTLSDQSTLTATTSQITLVSKE